MSVQRAQYEIPSSEFVEWIVYLDEEKKKLTKEDYYLARIAAEVRSANMANDKPVHLKDFFMVYGTEESIDEKEKTKMNQASSFFNRLISVYKGST